MFKKLRKKLQNDFSPGCPTLQRKNPLKNKKGTQPRTPKEIEEKILNVLKLSERPMTTKKIAESINLAFNNTKKHLEYLEFADEVESYKIGTTWRRWKIKR